MSPILSPPSGTLGKDMRGIWWLLSRKDWTADGQPSIDPVLGSDPSGILCYAATHFSAQFSRRDRSPGVLPERVGTGQNNTLALDGYDAYFGTYSVYEETGSVLHTLIGSVVPANVGITVSRDLRVDGDHLTIQLATTSADGKPIIRTLVWMRMD